MLKMHALFISLALLAFERAAAQDGTGGTFNFFSGRDIDYWREGKRVRDPLTLFATPNAKKTDEAEAFSGATVVRAGDRKPFSWTTYRDPRTPEFWDDGGDYIPPRPFREAASNPTSENVAEYLRWQEKKTDVVSRFQEALVRQAKETNPRTKEERKSETEKLGKLDAEFTGWTQLRIAYFYQSSCPHCRASVATIEEARRRGTRVTFVQLDARENPPLHGGSIPYDASWARVVHISSTPTWILKLGRRTATLTGSLTFAELEVAAHELTTKGDTE